MLATSVRVSPCSALCCASSDGRFTTTVPSTSVSCMSACSVRLISPLGPFTVILRPSICAVTPLGSATGFLPIRDICGSLPDHREHFTAHPGGARFAVGHKSLRRAEDRHAEAVLDARDLAHLDVAPQPPVLPIVQHLEVLDVVVVAENRRYGDFQLRHRHVHPAVARHTGVAHPGEHIGDGINNAHLVSPDLPAGFAHAGNLPAQRKLTETNAAQLELPQRAAAPAAALAAVVAPHLELRTPLHPLQPRLLRHEVS